MTFDFFGADLKNEHTAVLRLLEQEKINVTCIPAYKESSLFSEIKRFGFGFSNALGIGEAWVRANKSSKFQLPAYFIELTPAEKLKTDAPLAELTSAEKLKVDATPAEPELQRALNSLRTYGFFCKDFSKFCHNALQFRNGSFLYKIILGKKAFDYQSLRRYLDAQSPTAQEQMRTTLNEPVPTPEPRRSVVGPNPNADLRKSPAFWSFLRRTLRL